MATKYMHIHRLRRVYVWELPVRFFHWLNAGTILALVVTGFLIADPPALLSHKEAAARFTMGWIRLIHFIAGYVFLFNYLFRLYWSFAGNKYSSWREFVPLSKKFWKEIRQVLRMDILMLKGKEHLSVGHNALAGLTYLFAFMGFIVQTLTGFGLYASMSHWWLPRMFAWVPYVLGGDIRTRQVHHWMMWFFILFAVIHVYLVFYHDYVEGRGEISSMGGGWKFIEEDAFRKDQKETAQARSSTEVK